MRVLFMDVETSPALVWTFGFFKQYIRPDQVVEPPRMLCFAARFNDRKRTEFYSEFHNGHAEMVAQLHRVLDEADVVVHFNGKTFDEPWARTEILQAGLRPVVGLEAWLQPVQELSVEDQVSRAQFQMTLSSPDEAALSLWTPRLVDALRALPELRDVAGDLQDRGLALAVAVDRDAAARLGVTQASIDDALYDAFGQRLISTIYTQSAQYRVVLEADRLGFIQVPGA